MLNINLQYLNGKTLHSFVNIQMIALQINAVTVNSIQSIVFQATTATNIITWLGIFIARLFVRGRRRRDAVLAHRIRPRRSVDGAAVVLPRPVTVAVSPAVRPVNEGSQDAPAAPARRKIITRGSIERPQPSAQVSVPRTAVVFVAVLLRRFSVEGTGVRVWVVEDGRRRWLDGRGAMEATYAGKIGVVVVVFVGEYGRALTGGGCCDGARGIG